MRLSGVICSRTQNASTELFTCPEKPTTSSTVSLAALALAGCAAVPAAPVTPVAIADPAAVEPPIAADAAPTADGARAFVERVEKDLFDLSVIGGRAQWVNATYINDDTDALAAYFGTIDTEKRVQYATEAARWLATAARSASSAEAKAAWVPSPTVLKRTP